jgi:addiction module RelE/StbE family toxin
MRVAYGRRALAQLDEIFSYVARDSPAAAANMAARIESLVMLLGTFPQMGRATDKPGTRVIGVPGYPYLIFYRILADEVRILRVRHSARRPLPGYR